MKIASLVWYKVLPATYGGQRAITQLGMALARRLPFVMICSRNNEEHKDLITKRILPTGKLQFINFFLWRKIETELLNEKITHLIIEHCYYGLFARLMKKKHGIKFIIRHHNIEAERFRQLNRTGWKMLEMYEGFVTRKADLNIYLSEEDRQYAIEHYQPVPEKTITLPYFVKKNKPLYSRQEAKLQLSSRFNFPLPVNILLFNGTLDYEPNAAAVKNIIEKLVPLLEEAGFDFHIFITGRDKSKKNYIAPSISMTGEVEDIELFYSAADLFINPVTVACGIQTKTLEALARDLTTVVFENTCAGIDDAHTSGKLLRAKKNDWNDFVAKIMEGINSTASIPQSFYDHYKEEPSVDKLIAFPGKI
jgi:glycosyltransferase involved in cell wall biosynthesis